MTMKKTNVLRTTLVSLAGVGGAGIAALAIAAVCLIPVPSVTLKAASVAVTPDAAMTSRTCPGGLLDVVGSATDATTFRGFAAPTIASDVSNSTITSTPLSAPDNASGNPAFGPLTLSAPPSSSTAPALIAGAQTQSAAAETLAGLASAACGEGSTDQWLVGGSTEVGRTTLLLLSNALEVDATASIQIFGEKGAIDAPGMAGLTIKARSQRIISLASFAPNLVAPVVHVTTSGGQVLATLQQSVTRVVTASGVDFVEPGTTPARQQVIPGVALTGMARQDSEGGVVSSDLEPTVRVLVPGAVGAEVTATVIPAQGKPIVIKAKADPASTLQLPFTGVPDGIYTVVVTAEVPIVAGVRTIQAAADQPAPLVPASTPPSAPAAAAQVGGDFAWIAPALPLGGETLLSVPAGPAPVLTIFNAGDQPRDVKILKDGQDWKTVNVPAGSSAILAVDQNAKLKLTAADGLFASVTYQAVGQGASFPVAPASRLSSALTVYPR
jgi:hypothetical protein